MQETDLRAAIVSPRLVRLLDYWQAKRAGNGLPTRADIDPIDLPDLLGSISLIETVGPQPRLRYRLVGSGLYAAHGGMQRTAAT